MDIISLYPCPSDFNGKPIAKRGRLKIHKDNLIHYKTIPKVAFLPSAAGI